MKRMGRKGVESHDNVAQNNDEKKMRLVGSLFRGSDRRGGAWKGQKKKIEEPCSDLWDPVAHVASQAQHNNIDNGQQQ